MRTTVNIDHRLLAEAKLIAARQHRTIGSVLEDALRLLIEGEVAQSVGRADYVLHAFHAATPGVLLGVDLEDKESMAELLGDNAAHAPA